MKFYWVFISLLLYSGCSSNLLSVKFISEIPYPPDDSSSKIIYYETLLDLTSPDYSTEIVKTVIKFNGHNNTLPGFLSKYENSVVQLSSFEGRILNGTDVKETFSRNYLKKYNLSSRRSISQAAVNFIELSGKLKSGDLLETAAELKHKLPQLGFSWNELPGMASGAAYKLTVIVPAGYNINYVCKGGIREPEVTGSPGALRVYTFKGKFKYKAEKYNPFKLSNEPAVYITCPVKASEGFTWREFGNWYLDRYEKLTIPDGVVRQTAAAITSGLTSPLEKMKAIYNFCQQNIRYEQVYQELGEFFPNKCSTILEKKYGDCKDYSALIYSMAKSIGINVHPVLCFRSRGRTIVDIAVNQFNHMIILFEHEGKDYWLDGTNRNTEFGVTTSDLISQTALVIRKNNSSLKKIEQHPETGVTISGSLMLQGKDLTGSLDILLKGQYAADFDYYSFAANQSSLQYFVTKWFDQHISSSANLREIKSYRDQKGFQISINCILPNAAVKVDTMIYLSLLRIFPSIITLLPENYNSPEIAYYPNNTRVDLALNISAGDEQLIVTEHFDIPPGPFTPVERELFISDMRALQERLSRTLKIKERGY